MRRADPHFDEQLLRDAAQMACLIIFAAMASGDEQAIRRLATPPFWSTVFGRYVKTIAHDARVRRAQSGPGGQAARERRLPGVPVGTGHRVRVLQGRTADAVGPVAAGQRHRGR
jgi:hypothetical protein